MSAANLALLALAMASFGIGTTEFVIMGLLPKAPGSMTAISTTLNEQQIEQAAAYLSRLEP